MKTFLLAVLYSIVSAAILWAEQPVANPHDAITTVSRIMTYQGVLKDVNGDPMPYTFFNVTFRIFPQESGGVELWSQTISDSTDAVGCFSATLTNLNLPFNEDYWLELEIDGLVLTPRQRLSMAAYAARTDTADFARDAIFADTAEYARDAGIPSSGWVDMGSYVILQNPYANVSLGIDEPDEKLYIDGGLHVVNNATFDNGLNVEGTLIARKAGVGQDNNTAGTNTFAAGNNNNANGSSSFAAGTSNESGGGNSAVCGGTFNVALGGFSAILGGVENSVYQYCGAIVGGEINRSDGFLSTVISGRYNRAMSNFSLICGGHDDTTRGDYSTIIGGINCVISDPGDYSVLFGIDSYLDQDSTFMVDLPHIRFGDNSTGYEFPVYDGNPGQLISTNGAGQLDWADPAQSGGLRGNGTLNFLPRYATDDSLANSQIFDDGNNVGVGLTSPNSKLDVNGTIRSRGDLYVDHSAYIAGDLQANMMLSNGFQMYTGASPGHVLTSDMFGYGTWQPLNAVGGSGSQNYVAKFADVDSLSSSQIFDNGTNVGIGTTTPNSKLTVAGHIRAWGNLVLDGSAQIADLLDAGAVNTRQFQLNMGASSGHVLTSDASGNGTWQALNAVGGGGSQNYLPKFAGSDSLTNSIVIDNGSRIDVWGEIWGRSHLTIDGSASIADQVAANSVDIANFRMSPGAMLGRVLTSDASGNGTWQPLPAGLLELIQESQSLRQENENMKTMILDLERRLTELEDSR